MNSHDRWLQKPYEEQEAAAQERKARIATESEALMIEWVDIGKAINSVDGFELLLDERARIVSNVALCLDLVERGKFTKGDAVAYIGNSVINMVKAAAVNVATHQIKEVE